MAYVWQVRVVEKTRRETTISVVADSWDDARQAAYEQAEGALSASERQIDYAIDPCQADGEPWVTMAGDYEGGTGYYMDDQRPRRSHDVIVFETAKGHRFTKADVALLRSRIEAIGLRVDENWNGWNDERQIGYATVSFRIGNRVERTPLTREQMTALCAPREG